MPDTILIIARTLWGEARGEGVRGMQAVASVIGNRAKHPGWWGRDLASVCLSARHGVHQFSCWNASDPNYVEINAATANDPDLAVAVGLARQLAAGTLADITNGADSYYARGTLQPHWASANQMTCSVGQHVFFRVGLDGHAAPVAAPAGIGASIA